MDTKMNYSNTDLLTILEEKYAANNATHAAASHIQPLLLLQSAYLRLQAAGFLAGSAGIDSSQGIHIRWLLDGYLGQKHIPKGDYAGNTDFFNKPNDYVKLYRIPYQPNSKTWNYFVFQEMKPSIISAGNKIWIYNFGEYKFYLSFLDHTKYDTLRQTIDPAADPFGFINGYGDRLYQLELVDKLSFAVNVKLEQHSVFKVESFSVPNKSLAQDIPVISSRKTFTDAQVVIIDSKPFIIGRTVAENIRHLQFSVVQGSLISIAFETYEYFLAYNTEAHTIEYIDQFALTKDITVAETRLEDSTRFKVNDIWLKFNGDAFVNVKNYKDRWARYHGLQESIEKYIALSDTDPLATVLYNDESPQPDGTAMSVSLQNFLNVAGLDYHIARMLGMGYIDTKLDADLTKQYIYAVYYTTKKDPENYDTAKEVNHVYLSLPTSQKDQRLPQKLILDPITYGLAVNNGTGTPFQITDDAGYALYDPVRFIRLKARLKTDFMKRVSFFDPADEFQNSDFSAPVFSGIENRLSTETDWRKPELSHDDKYTDTLGINETQTIYFNKNEDEPTYIDQVRVPGINVYAAYPVNIFSRSSVLSCKQETDETIFRKANTLKPPSNIGVQLIQAEDPLLLTSANEQVWLQHIDASKTEILCRMVFDYYHIHDLNYGYGDKVQVYHKKEMPLSVIGTINSVDNTDVNVPECIVTTSSFKYISTGEIFVPRIDPAIKNKFVGGSMVYGGINYLIREIIITQPDGSNPSVRILKNATRESILVNGNTYQLQQIFKAPVINAGDSFRMAENLSDAFNWQETTNNKLAFEISLGKAVWPEHTETYTDEEGNTKTEIVKGIWDSADISLQTDGSYRFVFDNYILNNHPQYLAPDNVAGSGSVNWYQGYVRVHVQGDVADQQKRKELRVFQVQEINSGNKLVLLATDAAFSTTEANKNIKTGYGIVVNFHPGYRVYLRKDDLAAFNKAHILPAAGDGSRVTVMGLRTIDSTMTDTSGQVYGSAMSAPVPMVARDLVPPLRPRKPIGPMFATPPDFYNKATYSFKVEFEHTPWGLVFYRSDINRVLASLYNPETVVQIKSHFKTIHEDETVEERWADLLSFDYSANGGEFLSFPGADGTPYRFPNPDRADIFTGPYNKPADVSALIRDTVYSNMLPLTEQPLIFSFIKGDNYVPLPVKQNITDRNGILLPPDDPAFVQAPMAKKLSATEISFTDFTLDGNMDAETGYFYLVREMSNSMQFGPPCPFIGPVQLINTRPPDKLVVMQSTPTIASPSNAFRSTVVFKINKPAASQGISKIQVYRTTIAAGSLSIRTMEKVKEWLLSDIDQSSSRISIEDDFNNNEVEIPFGTPLYYRLVGVRLVNFIDTGSIARTIEVLSDPTDVQLTNIIEVLPPVTPIVQAVPDAAVGGIIPKVELRWNKTCYNGKYSLFFLNASNAWEKIFAIQSNDAIDLHFSFVCDLPAKDNNANLILYKFKVNVQNSSGMINNKSNIDTILLGEPE